MAGTGSGSSKPLEKICAIVEENDRILRETDIRIEYYKNAVEKVLDEEKNLKKGIKKIADQRKSVQQLNFQLESIIVSLTASREVATQSLIEHQYFEQLIAKQLETKEQEKHRVEQECRNLYREAQEKLKQNPLYRELEEQKVEFLKQDIKRRDLEVKIRQKKMINAQKKEIKKRIFYNFFIEMAEDFVYEKRVQELKKLKVEEFKAEKRLLAIQELKMRQKLGTPGDKVERMANITCGPEECVIENSQSKIEPPQQKKETTLFNEELYYNMLKQDEPKNVLAPPKVHILKQKVILPAFVVPNFAPPAKRKNFTIELSRKWQKLMRHSSRSSQSSQQSQLTQPDQLPTETPGNGQYESSHKDTDTSKLMKQPQENLKMLIEKTNNVHSNQYQMVDNMNVGAEQFKMENPQIEVEAPLYEPHYDNIDTSKPVMQPQETQMAENMQIETEQLNVERLQITGQEQAIGTNMFNMSLMEPVEENFHIGLDFDSGHNESGMRSPNFSFEMEECVQQPSIGPTEMPTFRGGGGFFSFGKNLLKF